MKELAENAMYQGVSRTERISVMDSGDYTDDSSVKHHLQIDGNDMKLLGLKHTDVTIIVKNRFKSFFTGRLCKELSVSYVLYEEKI